MPFSEPARLGRATQADSAEIAALYLAAHADALPYVHRSTSDDAVRHWIRHVMLVRGETWVARLGGRIVGFLALSGRDLDQLFLLPGYYRRGIGSLLLNRAKERSPGGLRLFAFRRNLRARAFYEAHGFRVTAIGAAGAAQDEPELAYEWTRPALTPGSRLAVIADECL